MSRMLVTGGSGSLATRLIADLLLGGNEVRTTEYRMNRFGEISTLDWQLGSHQIEAGAWFEHNQPAQHRVWYPFSAANNDLSPYDTPRGASVFTQYYPQFYVTDASASAAARQRRGRRHPRTPRPSCRQSQAARCS